MYINLSTSPCFFFSIQWQPIRTHKLFGRMQAIVCVKMENYRKGWNMGACQITERNRGAYTHAHKSQTSIETHIHGLGSLESIAYIKCCNCCCCFMQSVATKHTNDVPAVWSRNFERFGASWR